jgi:alcohol dehydrogenase class IV
MELFNFFLYTDISIGIGLFEKTTEFIKKQGAKKLGIIFDSNLRSNNYFNDNLSKIKNNIPDCFLLANESNINTSSS